MTQSMALILALSVLSLAIKTTNQEFDPYPVTGYPKNLAEPDSSDLFPDSSRIFLEKDEYSEIRETYFRDPNPDLPVYIPPKRHNPMNEPMNMTECYSLEHSQSYVKCNDSNWTEVGPDQFPDDLKYLQISGTNISTMEADSFYDKNIVYLDIVANGVIVFHSDAFRGLKGMNTLSIRGHDQVAYNENDSFFHIYRHLSELEQLILKKNELKIQGIDEIAKSNDTILPRLTYLSLEGNKLGRIEDKFFYELRESPLVDLNLKDSGLRSIAPSAFEHLPYLKHVDFHGWNYLLTPIHKSLPQALNSMNKEYFINLGLSSTRIHSLPYFIMDPVKKSLMKLNLSNNKLTNMGLLSTFLPTSAFPPMESLEELIFEGNLIFDVHQDLFDNVPKLKVLGMKNNKLETMYEGLAVPSLEELDLSFQCREGCAEDAGFEISPQVFSNMSNLRILKLTGVKATSFHRFAFWGLDGLVELHMDSSNLQTIPNGQLSPLINLTRLDLSHNTELTGFNSDTFAKLYNLEILNLSFSHKAFLNEDSKIRKQDPNAYLTSVLKLEKVRVLLMACSLIEDCKGDYEYDSPLDSETLEAFPNVEILDLSKNALSSWSDDRFAVNPNLKHLSLADNVIIFITQGMIDSFRRLKTLDFRQNPVSCNEMVTEFYIMAKGTPDLEIIGWKDGEGYFCSFQDVPESSMSFKEFALNHTAPIGIEPKTGSWGSILIAGAVLVALLFLTFLIIYGIKNRQIITYKVLLKIRNNMKEKRDWDTTYEYDVFVCHCEKDKQWVTQEFVPTLEKVEPRIKACIHERDFQVGLTVIENIVRCIDKSQNFLIVLSESFSSSQWCMFEMEVAQSRLIHNGSKPKSLIVIRKDHFEPRNKTLKFIAENWTYLRWPVGDNKETEVFYRRLKNSILEEIP